MSQRAEALALAVINDGRTYEARKRIARDFEKAEASPQARPFNRPMTINAYAAMCRAEARKPHYEGMFFERFDILEAARQVHAYMRQHYAESNQGADW